VRLVAGDDIDGRKLAILIVIDTVAYSQIKDIGFAVEHV
jgi:hypothetical protein